jgi:hypothetical protein
LIIDLNLMSRRPFGNDEVSSGAVDSNSKHYRG